MVLTPQSREKKTSGLRYWMLRVLEECDNVSADFSADPVHDLRVSLRRCRSLADGLMALDPDPEWKAMKKAGKRLFQRLGALRDVHVMEEWVEKLFPADVEFESGDSSAASAGNAESVAPASNTLSNPADSPQRALSKILKAREDEQKAEAKAALEEFDQKAWRRWSNTLPARGAHFRPGSALFTHLALERWTEARGLHNRALRNRSQVALHSLRIGIKRFRYIVENFLPAEHKSWAGDLKEIQDVLGEVHDLDVLWSTAISCHIFPDARARQFWREKILRERSKRVESYRSRMVGGDSMWNVWRAELPQGRQIQILATRRMKLWAKGLDPDFAHSERVAGLALQLYDGLMSARWEPAVHIVSARSSLLAAALLHDVGKFKGLKGHHKASLEMIRKHGNPLGWKEADTQRAALVARFHRGSLPSRRHKELRDLLPNEQKATMQLSAILRLANALDAGHDGHIHRIQVENVRPRNSKSETAKSRRKRSDGFRQKPAGFEQHEALVITAEGYSAISSAAQNVAAERHLLEIVLGRPVMFKPMKQVSKLHPERVRSGPQARF